MKDKVYTRSGDTGVTQTASGQLVSKGDSWIEAYGTIDELNSFLGLAQSFNCDPELTKELHAIQRRLFDLGSLVASLGGDTPQGVQPFTSEDTKTLERWIDHKQQNLPELKNFILPGGTELAASLHVARTVCRRAERALNRLSDQGKEVDETILAFVNRLSDYLFICARWANYPPSASEKRELEVDFSQGGTL